MANFQNKLYLNLIFIAYIVLSLYTVYHHEPWLDEAQAWLIARDCNLGQIFEQMKYEGTPALWHLILMPFAQLGFPYFSMQIIHWLFAVGMVYLLLYRSPFSIIMKGGITFSYIMMYEYAIKARCYNLAILLFFAIAVVYPKRMQMPILYAILIGLLCQTTILCVPAAFGLAVVFLYEIVFQQNFYIQNSKKLGISTILIMAFSGMFAFWQIYPPKSVTPYFSIMEFGIPLVKLWNVLQKHLASNVVPPGAVFRYSTEVKYSLEIGFNVFLIWLFIFTTIALRKHRIVWFLLCSIPFIWTLQAFLAKFHTRHYGFYVIIPLTAIWIYASEESLQKWSAKIVLYSIGLLWFLSLPFTLFYTYSDWKYDYSQSKEVAKYIIKNNLEQETIVAYYPYSSCSIAPYLSSEKKLWYPHNRQYGTFITWDNDNYQYGKSLSEEEVIRIVDAELSYKQPLILILSDLVEGNRSNPRLKLLYQNPIRTISSDERYHVYRLEKK